jgi:hypothetical protein
MSDAIVYVTCIRRDFRAPQGNEDAPAPELTQGVHVRADVIPRTGEFFATFDPQSGRRWWWRVDRVTWLGHTNPEKVLRGSIKDQHAMVTLIVSPVDGDPSAADSDDGSEF